MNDHERSAFLDKLANAHDAEHGSSPDCPIPTVRRSAARAFGAQADRGGPAQVATKAYRENWDGIFGKVPRGEA